jgi:signal transduction histidine kinase
MADATVFLVCADDGTRRQLRASVERAVPDARVRVLDTIDDLGATRGRTDGAGSDAAFRTIISTIADGIVIVDDGGTTRFVNPAAERIFGRSATELVGQHFGFPVVAGERADVEILHPQRGPVYAELRVSETEWNGEPACVATIRDITERRRSERRARQLIREQALRAAAEASERRARFLGEAGSILAASFDNSTALQKLARLAVPVLADWCIIDVLRDDGTFHRAGIATASQRGSRLVGRLAGESPRTDAGSGAARVLGLDGPQLAASASAPAVAGVLGVDTDDDAMAAGLGACMVLPLTARGRPLGIMTLCDAESGRVFDDDDLELAAELADRTAVAIENARLLAEAQEANQAKADFLAVMSHELRTPLNAIIGYADLLTMGVPRPIHEDSARQVDRIRSSAQHLLGLIEEILTFSRIEAGHEELHLEHVVVRSLVDDVASIIEPIAAAAGIDFDVSCADDAIELRTDPQKLRQVLVNLLSNAVKFTDDGVVSLAVESRSGVVEFRVTDTGCGIEPHDLDRIFAPFWQAEQSRTRRAGGTGLGLSVARRLARLIGGDIAVRSHPGDGSTFIVRLPLILRTSSTRPDDSQQGAALHPHQRLAESPE